MSSAWFQDRDELHDWISGFRAILSNPSSLICAPGQLTAQTEQRASARESRVLLHDASRTNLVDKELLTGP